MEIEVENHPKIGIPCSACINKQELIEKYENLITLLKKKADRSHLSQTNKLSIGDLTTSNSSLNSGNYINRLKLPLLLNKFHEKCKLSSFYQIKNKAEIKNALNARELLNKFQKILLNKEKEVFLRIKLYQVENEYSTNELCHESSNICNNLTSNLHPINLTMHKSVSHKIQTGNETEIFNSNKKTNLSSEDHSITIDRLNYKSLAFVHEDLINSTNLSQPLNFKDETIKDCTNLQLKNLYKKIFSLEQEIFTYQNKIKNLETNMQDALARQIKESTKKTESLEMVAEEMAEKNELIAELNEKITMLEERYRCETNGILEDELTQHRKEVEKLEKINIKFENELRKLKESLSENESSLKQKETEQQESQLEMSKLKEKLFELEHKLTYFEDKKYDFENTCKKIDKILQKLKHFEKVLFSQLKSHIEKENFFSVEEIKEIEEFYKLELIFVFIYNIEDETFDFSEHEHLFDEEQLEVLKELKEKVKNLKKSNIHKVDLMQTIQCAEYGIKEAKVNRFEGNPINDQGNLNQIESVYCHQNLVDGSIFDVLNDHRENNSIIGEISSKTERIDPEKNLTMKLLQLEIEKNKQIEKISELKEKNMYIRNIILNLIKSLELRQNTLKNETTGILELIFDVFEYSEEEKNLIFTNVQQPKEKRFFGLI